MSIISAVALIYILLFFIYNSVLLVSVAQAGSWRRGMQRGNFS